MSSLEEKFFLGEAESYPKGNLQMDIALSYILVTNFLLLRESEYKWRITSVLKKYTLDP